MKYIYIKRFFDIIVSIIFLILLSPFFLVIIIALFFNRKTKGVFFVQERPGKNGEGFKLMKFKTMNDEKDDLGNLLDDEKRVTKIGLFLRKTSLDEIPQFINVLIGKMSFIGPRPLLTEYLPLYNKTQSRRHDVRPGITGWAQVNGRNAISWKKKFELDQWYIEHISFKTDILILVRTIKKVLLKENITSETSVTVEKFTGNE